MSRVCTPSEAFEFVSRMQYHCEVRVAGDCPYWIAGTGIGKPPDIVTEGEHAGQYICAKCRAALAK